MAIRLWILAGNANGPGETEFQDDIDIAYPDDINVVADYLVADSYAYQWDQDWYPTNPNGLTRGSYWSALNAQILFDMAALGQPASVVFFLYLGEQDALNTATGVTGVPVASAQSVYADSLRNMIAQMRLDLHWHGVQFIARRIKPSIYGSGDDQTRWNAIRAAQDEVAAEDSRYSAINVDNFSDDGDGYTFDATGLASLTDAMITEAQTLLGTYGDVPGPDVTAINPDLDYHWRCANIPGGSGRHVWPPQTTVLRVTNLNNSGAGSLREACEGSVPTDARTILFEVSGLIDSSWDRLVIPPYCSLIGASAPAPGISVNNAKFDLENDDPLIDLTDKTYIYIQHIRARRGGNAIGSGHYTNPKWDTVRSQRDYKNPPKVVGGGIPQSDIDKWNDPAQSDFAYLYAKEMWESDAFGAGKQKYSVIDHCSFGLGGDETGQVSGDILMYYCTMNTPTALPKQSRIDREGWTKDGGTGHCKGIIFEKTTYPNLTTEVGNSYFHMVDRAPQCGKQSHCHLSVNTYRFQVARGLKTAGIAGRRQRYVEFACVMEAAFSGSDSMHLIIYDTDQGLGNGHYIDKSGLKNGQTYETITGSSSHTVWSNLARNPFQDGSGSTGLKSWWFKATPQEVIPEIFTEYNWDATDAYLPATDVKAELSAYGGAWPSSRDQLDTDNWAHANTYDGSSSVDADRQKWNPVWENDLGDQQYWDNDGKDIFVEAGYQGPTATLPGHPVLAENTHDLDTLLPSGDLLEIQQSGYTKLEEWIHERSRIAEGKQSAPDPDPPQTFFPKKEKKSRRGERTGIYKGVR